MKLLCILIIVVELCGPLSVRETASELGSLSVDITAALFAARFLCLASVPSFSVLSPAS